MKLDQLITKAMMDKAVEDQSDCDYIQEEKHLAVYVSGHYTIEELELKVIQLREANKLYKMDYLPSTSPKSTYNPEA